MPVRPSFVSGGFTLIELMTVVAMVGVIATLMLSAIAGAKKGSRQTVCAGNLRQIVLAVDLYLDDTGRRPRTLSRLTVRPSWLGSTRSLLCPQDPAAAETLSGGPGREPKAWGNVANESQEPLGNADRSDLEEPTFEQERLVTRETHAFSYLHPLGWKRSAFRHLGAERENQTGVAVCQLHGVRISDPKRLMALGNLPYLAWEGLTIRGQRDGAVVPRRLFHMSAGGGWESPLSSSHGTAIVPVVPNEYPWEFYSDRWPELLRQQRTGAPL